MEGEASAYFQIAQLVVVTLSSIAIPIVLLIIGSRYTKARELESQLRADRVELYNKILEPFLLIFTTDGIIKGTFKNRQQQAQTGVDLASKKLLTIDYQNYIFKLTLVGSDEVVRAFNEVMQSVYSKETDADKKGPVLIKLTADLMLAIRRSMGNEKTTLQSLELLEGKINDLRKYKVNGRYPSKLSIIDPAGSEERKVAEEQRGEARAASEKKVS